MKVIVLAFVLLASALGTVGQPRVSLEKRAREFYSDFSAGKFTRLWTMLSPRIKRENGYERQKYLDSFKDWQKFGLKFKIVGVKVKRNTGAISIETCIPDGVAPEIAQRCNTKATQWVRIHRLWYYDG